MSVPFAIEARQQFDPVARQFGFSCVASSEREVRYESDDVFLGINFDNARSYELGIEIGKKKAGQLERPFSFVEVLRLRGLADANSIDGVMVSDSGRLHEMLAKLAVLVVQHAADFLVGNDLSFAKIARFREKESTAYALERDLRMARAKAETAWINKNYRIVVIALESMEVYLSPSDKKRLDYARKHQDQ